MQSDCTKGTNLKKCTMIHIFSNSADLVRVAPQYANIARSKASKAKKAVMQHKKQRLDDVICANIDRPKSKATKQARQQAAKRAAKRKAKQSN